MGKKCEKVKKKEANFIEEEARSKIKDTYKSKGKDKISAKKMKLRQKWYVGENVGVSREGGPSI